MLLKFSHLIWTFKLISKTTVSTNKLLLDWISVEESAQNDVFLIHKDYDHVQG